MAAPPALDGQVGAATYAEEVPRAETLVSRVVTSIVSLPVLVLAVLAGGYWFSLLVTAAAAVAVLELCSISRRQNVRPLAILSVLFAGLLVQMGQLLAETPGHDPRFPLTVAATAAFSLLWLLMDRSRSPLSGVAMTVAAAAYVGGLLFHAPLLRELDQGLQWVLLLLAVTFATDTSAFFVGRALGRLPLAPAISPGKTLEGAVGGLAGAVLAAVIGVELLGLDLTMPETLVLGGLAGVAGQLGDLAESRLKRVAGVKDSGWLFPGHGGVLDRIDSIVFNLPVVYYFVLWFA